MFAVPEPFEPLRPQDPQRVSGYLLRARLGAGGMGQVYLSFTPGGRPVAVKTVRDELAADKEFRARFAQEARAAQQVNGIHIAQLLDADAEAPTPWLATAYVPGPSLSETLRLVGPLPPANVRKLIVAVAEALQAIHATGIIHRDLKPENVVIAADGPRVIDFGIARATDATPLTLTGVRVGTPQYTAPEQIRGHSATPAADVFALGALAYFAATGQPAFGEGPEFGVVYRVVHEEPDLARCPAELRDIVRACLAKQPGDRPTTAEVIAAWRSGDAAGPLPAPVQQAIRRRETALAPLSAPPPPGAAFPPGRAAVPPAAGAVPPGPPRTPAGATGPPGQSGPFGATGPTAVSGPPGMAGAPVGVPETRAARSEARRYKVAFYGLCTVLAAGLVAFLVAGLPAILGEDSAGSGSPSATPSSPAAQTAASQPGEQSSPSQSPTPTSATVRWSGPVRFDSDGIDLDPVPPQVTSGSERDVTHGSCCGHPRLAGENLATWTGSAAPTAQQCSDLSSTQGDTFLDFKPGDRVCLRTEEGHVALMKIDSMSTNGFGVRATVTVWAPTGPGTDGPTGQ